jgi:hypothetical protein
MFVNGELSTNTTAVDENDDTEYDCVLISSRPSLYRGETPMPMTSGVCGYKFQIINANEEFGFSFDILKDSASALVFGSSFIAVALAFF